MYGNICGIFRINVECVNKRGLNETPEFADEIFKCIFLNVNIWNFREIIHLGPFGNKAVLVQVMNRCRKGDKPLLEPIVTQSTHVSNWFLVSMSSGPGVF